MRLHASNILRPIDLGKVRGERLCDLLTMYKDGMYYWFDGTYWNTDDFDNMQNQYCLLEFNIDLLDGETKLEYIRLSKESLYKEVLDET